MNDIVTFLTSHNYLALALFLIVYARKLASPDSSFPVTIPTQWLPVVTGGLAMAYAGVNDIVQQKHLLNAVLDSLEVGGSIGVADALLTAIFASGNAPKWARAIVFIFDDLTGGSTQGKGGGQAPPKPPTAVATSMLATTVLVASLACASCIKNGQIVPPPDPIPQDLQQVAACVIPLLEQNADFPTLVAKCSPQDAQLIIDVLALLGKSEQFAADHASASVQASICYQQARRAGKVKSDE